MESDEKTGLIDASYFYQQYHGHPGDLLLSIVSRFRQEGRSLIWTAGDSSLDNKHWFSSTAPAVHGYEDFLRPPVMKQDVTYWLNYGLKSRGDQSMAAVNTAIEESCLNDRSCTSLLEQDVIIRDNISKDDILVVSVGGNDIALKPLVCTICSMLSLVYCSGPQCVIERCSCACPPNTGLLGELGCLGCGVPNCVTSCLCGFPPGFGYIVDLFKNRVENYVRQLVSQTKPKKILVCMIYFLDEQAAGSWADPALKCLCYDMYPSRLQAGIEAAFRVATRRIRIPGTEIVPVPLFEALDGKTTADYRDRVEPSPSGGRKMADLILDAVFDSAPGGRGEGPRAELIRE